MTTKEEIIELLDGLNQYQQEEIVLAILAMTDHPRGRIADKYLERTKSINLDQDMVDAIEEAFPIRKAFFGE